MSQRLMIGDRFEIERMAGVHGIANAYRAHDRASGEVVMVKALTVKALLEGSASTIARIRWEGSVLAKLAELHHPGIVRYVAHGTAASMVYVATEWLEGEDLARRLQRQRLTVDETVMLMARATEALAVVHALGIVHRNLEPCNLFLIGRDVARTKLIEFESDWLEKAIQKDLQGTNFGLLRGGLAYMAPEQVQMDSDIDARADVFSLGVVLFECLTGEGPFPRENPYVLGMKIQHEDAPRVRDLCPEVPAELDTLVARMLARNPEERPRDGSAVVEALAATGLVKA
jgi:eukaryotic-like serine/threonine-protein kinase